MFEKVFGEVRGIFNTITIIDMIISLFYIILGIIFFSVPSMSNLIVSIITGIILIINGISSIFTYIKRESIEMFNYNLIYGIFLIVVGILAMILKNVLSIILGVYLIITGIQKATYGILLKKYNESSWLITLSTGIIFVAIAILAFFTSRDKIVEVVGICLIGYGIINMVNTILLRRRSNYFLG